MRFRLIMAAIVLAVMLAILFVVQTQRIVGGAQEQTKQGNRAAGPVGGIVSAAIGGVIGALVGGIVGTAKSVFEVPQSHHQNRRR